VEEIGIKDIRRINDALLESRGVDFNNYALSSYKRRILRFIEINKIRELDFLLGKIRNDRSYADSFIKEITVNVTEMFRDPTFWIVLRDSILPYFNTMPIINIWHAACSTGEEVYSMAILLEEAGMLNHSRIVATDINNDVLDVARKGVFLLKNQETNTKNYIRFGGKRMLSDYYTVNGNTVQFDKRLVSRVDFICHNLAQEDPLEGFDLVLCRNVLIYFNFELQEKVIQSFAKSMSKGSFLGIGSKESIAWCKASRLLRTESQEENIYMKIGENERDIF
jgi:chemotaxis protein methyltransferase CheR